MQRLVLMLAFVFFGEAQSASAQRYKLEQVKEIDDARLGVKKIYFDVACNQEFLQVLSEEAGTSELKVAVLTLVTNRDCNGPSRRIFVRYSPHGRSVTAVSGFDQVWSCEGYCFTPGGPDMPPYNRPVQAFGTSELQAVEYLGCRPPYLQDLSCAEIDVKASE